MVVMIEMAANAPKIILTMVWMVLARSRFGFQSTRCDISCHIGRHRRNLICALSMRQLQSKTTKSTRESFSSRLAFTIS